MFSLLESKKGIAKAQRKLEATIRRDFTETAVKDIGYPGGTRFDAKVNTDGRHWFWSNDHRGKNGKNARRLNWFGLFQSNADLQISVEINTPYEKRNDRVNGFFGRDSRTGAVYLLHSGRPGGSTKGVGKSTFLAWSDVPLTDVMDSSGDVRSGVVVMPIEGRVSRHGDVVDALNTWRNAQSLAKGARSVKNVLFDLGISVGSDLIEVYEVKTSASRSLLYSAIGQLLVHGTADGCQRFIVLPEKEVIAPDLSEAMQRLGIKPLKFRLDKAKATIIGSSQSTPPPSSSAS